jgi:putative transposase
MMCRQLGVTRAGFYAWQARGPSQRQLDDLLVTEQIRSVHSMSLNTYGSPRVTHAMRLAGVAIGRRRVARLMRRAHIQGRSARLY